MEIGEKIVIKEKERGKYKAFPTIVRIGDEFIVAYREGFVDFTKPHGRSGRVKFLKSRDLKAWKEFDTPFCDNELDAILSGPIDGNLFLITRSYEHGKRNDVYLSRFRESGLPTDRKLLKFDGVSFTCFGHIFKEKDELIMTAYGVVKGIESPMVFSSSDFGQTWSLKSLITPLGHEPVLNETTIAKLNGRFIAIMRSREPSFELYCAFSGDLESWSKPEKMGILGHAPMLRVLRDGRLAFVFRDLNGDLPGVGVAFSGDGVNWSYKNICTYIGDLYNGGYADFVQISDSELFVVYYISNETNEPWIEGQIVEIK